LASFLPIDFRREDQILIQKKQFVEDVITDIYQIIKMANLDPTKIYLYLPPSWKQTLYENVAKTFGKRRLEMAKIMQLAKKNTMLKQQMAKVAEEAQYIMKNPATIHQLALTRDQQRNALIDARRLIKKYFKNVEIQIEDLEHGSPYDPGKKARYARPMKPAIFVE
jgi:leucyl-tRNA synthetase